MDGGLYAAYIGQDTAAVHQILELRQISGVVCYRRTEKDVCAAFEVVIYGRAGGVDRALLYRQRQCLAVFVKGKKFIVRIVTADRLRNGAADQSEADKADFY